jgi:ribosomal protein S18 acetylase RimI-like enzyme
MSGAPQFEIHTESLRTPALELDYYRVPWDTQILGVPVAQIAGLRIFDAPQAARDYEAFAQWCATEHIALCACRVPASRLVESMFLEERGFRFIELNYTPRLDGLQAMQIVEPGVDIRAATEQDREALADMAAQVFRHGRLHQDPRIDPALGDRRYRVWMVNAFSHPRQTVLKCLVDGAIVGFFVVEYPAPDHCFWSLIGLAPALAGRGLGKRVWRAVLSKLHSDGINVVSTSISSHNIAVFNLYVALGFRFPEPAITLQWRPPGAGVLS